MRLKTNGSPDSQCGIGLAAVPVNCRRLACSRRHYRDSTWTVYLPVLVQCDKLTRTPNVKLNPAALLALAWYESGNGKGAKNMVVLPYKDRLDLFSKYLQQLLMESLGKELDLDKHIVNQGITVLGNKGSTDQHSYIQQLRDGLSNFFVSFIEVLNDERHPSLIVEPDVTSGDFLHGFYLGTRQALAENGRESMTLTIKEVSPFAVGMLIALFERAVGFYARWSTSTLIINLALKPARRRQATSSQFNAAFWSCFQSIHDNRSLWLKLGVRLKQTIRSRQFSRFANTYR